MNYLGNCTAPEQPGLLIKLTMKDSLFYSNCTACSPEDQLCTGACKPARMMHLLEIKSAGQRQITC